MAESPSIEEIVAQIRTAIYGRDVRENIALGIEKCYEETGFASVSKISGTDDDYVITLNYHSS